MQYDSSVILQSSATLTQYADVWGNGIARDAGGNCYVSGSFVDFPRPQKPILTKFDSSLNSLSVITSSVPGYSGIPEDVQVGVDGGIWIAENYIPVQGGSSFSRLIKYDSNLTVEASIDIPSVYINKIAFDQASNVWLAGQMSIYNGWIGQYSSVLSFISSMTMRGSDSDGYASVSGLARGPDDSMWAAGNVDGHASDLGHPWLARIIDPPPAPSLSGAASSPTSITWTWPDVARETGYRMVSESGEVLSGDLAADTVSWGETGLSTNTAYSRQAVAMNGAIISTSAAITRYTLAAPATGLVLSEVRSTSITLSWQANTNPAGTSYQAMLWQAGGTTATLQVAATSATFTGLARGATYYLTVRAKNQDDILAAAPMEVSAITLRDAAAPMAADFSTISSTNGMMGEAQFNSLALGVTAQITVRDAFSGLAVSSSALIFTGDGHDSYSGSSAGYGVMYTTSAGQTWIDASTVSAGVSVGGWVSAMAVFNGKLYAGDYGSNKIFSSADGLTWDAGTPVGDIDSLIVFNGKIYAGDTYNGKVYSSVDGAAWDLGIKLNIDSVNGTILPFAVFNGRLYASNTAGTGRVYSTADGATWDGVTNVCGGTNVCWNVWSLAVFNGKLYATDGNIGKVYSSADGKSWDAGTAVGSSIYGLAVFNGKLYAADGNNGKVYSTADGATWTSGVPVGGSIRPLAVFNGKLYAGDLSNNNLYSSADGVTWNIVANVGSPIFTLAGFNDKLYAGARNGRVYQLTPVPASLTGLDGSTEIQTLSATNLNLVQSTNTITCNGVSPCGATNQVIFTVSDLAGNVTKAGPFAVLVDTTALPERPGAPIGVALGVSSISWTWSVAPKGSGYTVRPTTSPATILASTVTTAYHQIGLTPITTFSIVVAGFNDSGPGPLSAAGGSVYTLANPPAGLAASEIHMTSAAVQWDLNGNPSATTAELERSADNASFAAAFSGAATSFVDTSLAECSTYYFRVRNRNGDAIATAYAGTLSFMTNGSTPSAPGSLQADAVSGNRISLSWTASPSSGVVQYRLYNDGGTGVLDYNAPMAVLTSTQTSYATAVLASSAAYRFALRAKNRCGVEETGGVFAIAASTASLADVRVAIKSPDSGKRIKGNSVTIVAELTAGIPGQVQQVTFQYRPAGSQSWANIPAGNANHPNPDTDAPYFIQSNVDAWGVGTYDLRAVAINVAGSSDTAASGITVTVEGNAALADINENMVAGKVEKQQTVNSAVTTTIGAAGGAVDDPSARLILPAGVLPVSTASVTMICNPTITTSPPAGYNLVGPAVSITLGSGLSQLNGSALVTLSYPDTLIHTTGLRMQSLDGSSGIWSLLGAPTIDTVNRTVTARTTHFSIFALVTGGLAAADMGGIRVYPIPYKPNGNNPDEGVPYAAGNPNSGIIFDNLPRRVSIAIYTLAGRRVAKFDSDNAAGKVQWDARNDSGQDVASGGYLAVISSPGMSDVVKKILIIR